MVETWMLRSNNDDCSSWKHGPITMNATPMTHDAPFAELEIEGSDAPCSYLPGRTARMVYRIAYDLSEDRYQQLLSRGWRRFGRTLFRPMCAACQECRSLRVIISDYRPNKNQRRSYARNAGLTLTVRKPSVTDEHIELYNRYHTDMHERRHWPSREITKEQYYESFMEGNFTFAREFQYRDNGHLVGLGLVDVTSKVMSSIYFVHAPEYRDAALGTYSIQKEIEYGLNSGHSQLYMGYYIRDCGSMNYKNRYRPFEILKQYVSDDMEPVWERFNEPEVS